MKDIVKELRRRAVPLNEYDALDAFARTGEWQTIEYFSEVKSLEAWEINPAYEAQLKNNLPGASIKITDAFNEVRKERNLNRFDFIVIDAPLGCYGPRKEYCEHFDILQYIPRVARINWALIFNVNKEPFDYDKYPLWQRRRERFYKRESADKLSLEFLHDHYRCYFNAMGIETKFSFHHSRHRYDKKDFLYSMCFMLQKKGAQI